MLENQKIKKKWIHVLKVIIENSGKASFSQIKEKTNIPSSTLAYTLKILKRNNLIISIGKGLYKLKYFTPYIFLNKKYSLRNIVYFGLLGLKMNREKPEYNIAIAKLNDEKYKIKKIVIATTIKALDSWGENILENIDIIILKEKYLFNPVDAEKVLRKKIIELIEKYPVIVDITSGPRTAALAMYKIAMKYSIPTIYIREDTKQLIWINKIENILENYHLMFN